MDKLCMKHGSENSSKERKFLSSFVRKKSVIWPLKNLKGGNGNNMQVDNSILSQAVEAIINKNEK